MMNVLTPCHLQFEMLSFARLKTSFSCLRHDEHDFMDNHHLHCLIFDRLLEMLKIHDNTFTTWWFTIHIDSIIVLSCYIAKCTNIFSIAKVKILLLIISSCPKAHGSPNKLNKVPVNSIDHES